MAFQIRPFSLSDDLLLTTQAEEAAYLDANPHETSLEQKVKASLERITRQVGGDSYLGFTATENGSPVGLIFADIEDDPAYIDNLYIASDKRGRGIGEKLLTHVVEAVKSNGVKTIELMVSAENNIAVHLYQKLGFKISRFRMNKTFDE